MSRLRLRTLGMALWILICCGPVLAQQQMPEGWDRYLGHPRGPYRGLIIDSDTKAPLPGAVVVALWRRDRVYPFQVNSERYAARETVTDSEGRFVMEVRDVEEGAPRRTHKPEFLVFLPGYGSFPSRHSSPNGFIAELFYASGGTVELRRLHKKEDRLDNLSSALPHGFSEKPHSDLPMLVKAVDVERTSLGLSPYPPPEKE
jgi:hypothetical protein